MVIAPAILVLLLIGLFPLVYSLVVSFQKHQHAGGGHLLRGLVNYRAAVPGRAPLAGAPPHRDHPRRRAAARAGARPAAGAAVPRRVPGRQIFVALLVLPTVISPIVAGATWRLLFDNRYGPINQILGWFAGEPLTLLWTVNPRLVYPAILICRDLAVDAVHVPDAAGGAVQCRPVADSRRRRSTAPAIGAPSARSCCRRSGR